MANTHKMTCPTCGVDMNHHCDKLVYTVEPDRTPLADLSLGGIIEEFHACPECGGGASRQA